MKVLQIVPRVGTRLYSAVNKKQAEIRRTGRGTFSRAKTKPRGGARWRHVRYKGSIDLTPGDADVLSARIKSSDHGDEARLLSSFLGWIDRHFGGQIASVNIEYQQSGAGRRR